jgi:hypothetical protein
MQPAAADCSRWLDEAITPRSIVPERRFEDFNLMRRAKFAHRIERRDSMYSPTSQTAIKAPPLAFSAMSFNRGNPPLCSVM